MSVRRFFAALIALVIVALAGSVSAGPPPLDPKQMSGIPRPDAEVPAGHIMVRVLLGSFENPALEHPVTLLVANADGTQVESRSAMTGNQGRANFDGLEAFVGGYAVAEVEFDGQRIRSQPIDLRADVGTKVMLVQGAKRPPADVPLPGIAFELDRVPAGTLMVGTFDLAKRGAIENIEVTLTITPPEGEPFERKASTDAEGRVMFEELAPPAVPEGSRVRVSAQLVADGPIKVSNEIVIGSAKGMGVVLAEGRIEPPPAPPQADPHAAHPQMGRGRPIMGPRPAPDLPQGSVRVRVVDGRDRPVVDQRVEVIKKSAAASDVSFPGQTGPDGIATIADLPVDSESFYMVGVTYDRAPYSSGFFALDKAGGIAVDVRVWEVTHDASVIRSALQFTIDGSENDLARVIRLHEVMVEGDKAFWPLGGTLRLDTQPGAKGVTVLKPAEPWLDHEDAAPYATLARPLPPGEVANLSIGYLLEHDGDVEVEYWPPFPTVQTTVVVPKEYTLDAIGAQPREPDPERPDLSIYNLGERAYGSVTEIPLIPEKPWVALRLRRGAEPVVFAVAGLPIRNPIYRWLAIGLGAIMALALVVGLVRRPRATVRQRLEQRRDQLLSLLRDAPAGPRRDRIVLALDRTYRQLDRLAEHDAARTTEVRDAPKRSSATARASDDAAGDRAAAVEPEPAAAEGNER